MCLPDNQITVGTPPGSRLAPGVEGIGSIPLAGYFPASNGVPQRRVYPYYALVYTVSGAGFYQDDLGRQASLSPGDLVVLFPGIGHAFGPQPDRSWSEIFVTFVGPIFQVWREAGLLTPDRPIIRLEPLQLWASRLGELTMPGADPGEELRRLTQFQCVLADILGRREGAGRDDAHADWIRRASASIHALVDRPFSGPEIAKHLGMGYDAFRKRYTRLTGESPRQTHTRQQFQLACTLLERYSVQETADRLGFCDPYHFAHRFHEYVGMWPSEYKRRIGRE